MTGEPISKGTLYIYTKKFNGVAAGITLKHPLEKNSTSVEDLWWAV